MYNNFETQVQTNGEQIIDDAVAEIEAKKSIPNGFAALDALGTLEPTQIPDSVLDDIATNATDISNIPTTTMVFENKTINSDSNTITIDGGTL